MPKTLEPIQTPSDHNSAAVNLEQAIQDAIAQARQACELQGSSSSDCAVAWDVVEELQAERAHKKASTGKTSLDRYCDEFPEAAECRIYDV